MITGELKNKIDTGKYKNFKLAEIEVTIPLFK